MKPQVSFKPALIQGLLVTLAPEALSVLEWTLLREPCINMHKGPKFYWRQTAPALPERLPGKDDSHSSSHWNIPKRSSVVSHRTWELGIRCPISCFVACASNIPNTLMPCCDDNYWPPIISYEEYCNISYIFMQGRTFEMLPPAW